MNAEQNAVVERIKKILTRTQGNGCTEAESQEAFARASRMLAEHNLTMEEVRSATTNSDESFITEEMFETGRWTLEDTLCYGILKTFYFVEAYLDSTSFGKRFSLFGKAENVAVAKFVWGSLQAEFDRHWTTYKILNKRPSGEKRLYVAGMAKGYSEKLRAEREAQTIERDLVRGPGTGNALACISDKLSLALKTAHPELKPNKNHHSQAVGDQSTLDAGYQAGKKLNLNRAVGGRGRKAIG